MKRIVIIFLLFLSGCAGLGGLGKSDAPPKPDEKAVYEAEEIGKKKELARRVLQAARDEYGLVTDHEITSLVNQVGTEIVEAAGDAPSTYHFFVIKGDKINAFAVPGGYIFVFDGLLKRLNSVDALAGVLAHEVGHVNRNHFYDRRVSATNIATMAAVILAGMAGGDGGAAGVVAQAVNITQQLKYSRENEEEADFFAVRTMRRTRYNPQGLSDFFKTLNHYERTVPDIIPYLSTHPGVDERLARVELMMKDEHPRARPNETGRWDWGRIATILAAGNMEDVSFHFKRIEQDEDGLSEERGHYLKGLYALKKGDYKGAVFSYKEAIRLNPEDPLYHSDLGEVYVRLKEVELAREEALKALDISSNYASPYLILGMVEQAGGRHEKAITYLKDAERLSYNNPLVYYHLALSYHNLKMPGEERYYLGRYFRLRLEPEKAFTHLKNALSHTEGNEGLAIKIKWEIEDIIREGV